MISISVERKEQCESGVMKFNFLQVKKDRQGEVRVQAELMSRFLAPFGRMKTESRKSRADTRTKNNDVIETENETEEPMKEDKRMIESYHFNDNYSMQ
jgi:hypothetical protein